MLVFIATVVLVAIAMLAMGIGLIFSNRCLRGSCGGPGVMGPDGESLTCDACPNREEESAHQEDTQPQRI